MTHPPVHPGDTVTEAQARRVLDGLKDRSLPKPEWTHGAHLTAAIGLLDEMGLSRAIDVMPGLIRRYNEATGGRNTDAEGYHHTITLFYLAVIDDFCATQPSLCVAERVSDLLASPIARPDYLLGYYSKPRLFSVEARRRWAWPDLAAHPALSRLKEPFV